ncbi:phosphatase PAP2 family protein [Bifidobacterium amazonense]|uniref:Phosphatase PAP2 family protein n=1 Tax=Bifidobacterium amazonense TaxID=2809027 RepID=A0ABS9VZ03_9BIFI|nr:phosphatase PAP2 family protein [Bifidobacterium amazonense]MCH9277025.1 phosphatase PAP2 family protein [Bifidobacterium amazonense]
MMKQNTAKRALLGTMASVATIAMLACAGVTANAADAYPSDAAQPDLVKLLADYENYYQPANTYDKNDPSKPFGKGTVKDAATLKNDDDMTLAINQAAAKADAEGDGTKTATHQQKRALIDADYKMAETLPDALGPVLGKYFSDGLADGSLPKTSELLISNGDTKSLVADYLDTGTAKVTFNHTRPLYDRTDGGYVAAGLEKTVPITHVPNYGEHKAGYDDFATSGSFPSGHTTYAYSGGIALATLFPQLAPEIVTRASEAGNNRIVLGVHYPLDIMGGRIDGEVANATRWSDEAFRKDKLIPAYNELQSYMADKCVADGYATKQAKASDTVQTCVNKLGANAGKGYTNSFVDAVSKVAVTDRKSAIEVFTNRMTYNFKQTGKAGQAAVVPEGAENLLITAFPTLTADQRKAVLAASEIDSGYPLDASSEGYQRINLAKAYSAKVTLSKDGKVENVEFGQPEASVVVDDGTSVPVYRLYNNVTKLHLYTADANEKDTLAAKAEWTVEGVVFNAAKKADDTTPVYRLYNAKSRAHLMSSDDAEIKALTTRHGWKVEGIAWYQSDKGTVPVYRMYSPTKGEHLYTTDTNEYQVNSKRGWTPERVAWMGL